MARRNRTRRPRFLLAAVVSVLALTLGGFGATANATMDRARGDAEDTAPARPDDQTSHARPDDANATEDGTQDDAGETVADAADGTASKEHAGTDREDAAEKDDETHDTHDASGSVAVGLTADRSTVPESGADVTFTVTIRNTLEVEAEISHLHDSEFGALTGDADCGVGTTLGAGGSCSFSYDEWIEGTFPGTFETIVTAEIRADGQSYGDSASVHIRLTKASDASSAGTVKVDGIAFDDHPDNEPHPGCTFEIDFYGFPEGSNGELQATATFALWPPTGSGQVLATASTDVGEDEAGGGRDLDGSLSIDLSSAIADSGVRAHPVQGYHVRLTVDAAGTVKHKVFWVDCGGAPTPATGIHVDKTTDVGEVPASGGDVTYTFSVENEGSVDLTIDSLTDDVFGTLAGDDDCKVGTVLAAGTSCSFTMTETLSGTVGASHVNVFTASGTSHGEAVTDSDSASVLFVGETTASVLVTKTADVEQIDADGGDVTFTFVVENTSSADLTITGLTDDVFGTLAGDDDCTVGTVLAAGTSCSFTVTETLTGYPGASHVNVVTVTGTVSGETVTDTDSETVLFAAVSGGVVTPTPSPSPGSTPTPSPTPGQTPSPGTSPGQGPGVGPTQGGNGPNVLGASVQQTPVTAPSSLAFTGPSTGILLVLGGAAVALFVLGGIAYALGRRIRNTV